MGKTNERRIRLRRIDFNRGWKPLPHELKSKLHKAGLLGGLLTPET